MQVDFYVLDTNSSTKSLQFACQLIEKAYLQQETVYIYADSKPNAIQMDNLLWTFREDSFVPHDFDKDTDYLPPPVRIGYQQAPSKTANLLVNLTPNVPEFYRDFSRIIEIVFSDDLVQQLARDRYKQYRDYGCQLSTHKIKSMDL